MKKEQETKWNKNRKEVFSKNPMSPVEKKLYIAKEKAVDNLNRNLNLNLNFNRKIQRNEEYKDEKVKERFEKKKVEYTDGKRKKRSKPQVSVIEYGLHKTVEKTVSEVSRNNTLIVEDKEVIKRQPRRKRSKRNWWQKGKKGDPRQKREESKSKKKKKRLKKKWFKKGKKWSKRGPRKHRRVADARINVLCTVNNTHVNLTDKLGNTLFKLSAGMPIVGVPNRATATAYAGIRIGEEVGKVAKARKKRYIDLWLSGFSRARKGVFRGLRNSGVRIIRIGHLKRNPHNGCRGRKLRRL